MKNKAVPIHKWRYRLIAKKLRQSALIAFPTEAVWMLGCLPEDERSIDRIMALKGRGVREPMTLVAADVDQLLPYIGELSSPLRAKLDQTWPGPTTILAPKSKLVTPLLSDGSEYVAIRVSEHPVLRGICLEVGQPIISIPANPIGKRPAENRLRLKQYFGDLIDDVVPGDFLQNSRQWLEASVTRQLNEEKS